MRVTDNAAPDRATVVPPTKLDSTIPSTATVAAVSCIDLLRTSVATPTSTTSEEDASSCGVRTAAFVAMMAFEVFSVQAPGLSVRLTNPFTLVDPPTLVDGEASSVAVTTTPINPPVADDVTDTATVRALAVSVTALVACSSGATLSVGAMTNVS